MNASITACRTKINITVSQKCFVIELFIRIHLLSFRRRDFCLPAGEAGFSLIGRGRQTVGSFHAFEFEDKYSTEHEGPQYP